VVSNFISPEAKSGLNLIVSFCAVLAAFVFSHLYGASSSPFKTTFFKSRFRTKVVGGNFVTPYCPAPR
jgi:hypothetical protein